MGNIYKPPCDEGVMLSAPQAKNSTGGTWILAAMILGSSMAFIDGSVVNVALPALQKAFSANSADLQWVVEAYSLFLAALILVGGSLGDTFGRRRIFTLGVIVFALSSVCCGLAPNILLLIIARSFQGIGGALLVPGSLAIISASFSPDKRGRAIGIWSGFTSITSAIGPVLGGWLVEHASWHWVFFINVPLAVVVLILIFWRVPESRDEEGGVHLDWTGALLVTIGLAGVVYGLIEAGSNSFGSPTVIAALLIGVVALIVFVLHEGRTRYPMLPLTLFRSRTFSGTNLLTLFLYAALSGALYFFPFNLIQVQGYSPALAGSSFLPFSLLLFALSRWSGGLVDRFGPRLPLVIGPSVAAAGFALFALPGVGGSYWATFFPAVLVLGLGMAITVAPLTTAVMGAVDSARSGVASGINNAVSRVAGLLAIGVLGIVAVSVFGASLDTRLAQVQIPPAARAALAAQHTRLAAAKIPADLDPATRTALKEAVDRSYLDAFRLIMFICAGLALASAASAWALVEGRRAGVEPERAG